MNTIYVCHPFSCAPERNIKIIREICRLLTAQSIKDGELVEYLAPQLYLPQFMDDDTHRKEAMDICLHWLERCDGVFVCSRTISNGMRAEIRIAHSKGIPILFLEDVQAAIWSHIQKFEAEMQ